MEREHAVGPAEFTRRLLLRRRKAPVALPLLRSSAPGGAPRMTWIAEAVKRDALGWAIREGGWRARTVVVGGRRREGRLWDSAIFPRLGVRFSAAPLHLLVASMGTHAPFPALSHDLLAALRTGVEGDDPATGDLLAVHRVLSSLQASAARRPGRRSQKGLRCPGCGTVQPKSRPKTQAACVECAGELDPDTPGDDAWARDRRDRLRALSPLSLAYDLEAAGSLEDGAEGAARALAPLFCGDRAALLTYLDQALASAWLEAEARRWQASPQVALESYLATARGLEGYVLAARQRPDALAPLMAFYSGYVLRRFGGRAAVFEALTQKSQAFNRASERQEFLRAAGAVFRFGQAISDAADEALAAPFVDRSEEQKVLLAEYHDRFKEIAPEVEAIRRELVGEIG